MSKKMKKSQIAENQEASTPTAEKNQMEVTQADVETISSTIVEAGEAEVFPGQTEGQEAEVFAGQETQTETEVSVAQAPEQTAQPEQAAPKPPRVSKRPYIARVCELLEAGTHTAKEIVDLVLVEFPAVKKGGIQTFTTDLKNAKYRHWKDRPVVVNAAGKLQFADKITPVEVQAEVVTPAEEEQPEQPAE